MNVLDIGDILETEKEALDVWAVLGSCITVIFHLQNKITLMCHSQIPTRSDKGGSCFENCPNPCFNELEETNQNRYVTCSLEYMIHTLKKKQIALSDLNTTVIGGASLIGKLPGKETVGEKNIRIVKEILKKGKIAINREYTGGNKGLNFWYNTGTDKLIVKIQNRENRKFELLNRK